MAQMGFFDLSDRYAKKDSLVEVNAVVQWEGSGQHWSGSGAIFRDDPYTGCGDPRSAGRGKVHWWNAKTKFKNDHRGNLSQGGRFAQATFSEGEVAKFERIAKSLSNIGINYCCLVFVT